jgi:hypothetical protein
MNTEPRQGGFSSDERTAFAAACRRHGLHCGQFRIGMDWQCELEGTSACFGRKLTITCVHCGGRRNYRADGDAAWLDVFESDLRNGCFAWCCYEWN